MVRRALVGVAFVAAVGGCATAPTQPRTIGPDVLELTRHTADRAARADTQRIDLEVQAAAYCGQQGKALSVARLEERPARSTRVPDGDRAVPLRAALTRVGFAAAQRVGSLFPPLDPP